MSTRETTTQSVPYYRSSKSPSPANYVVLFCNPKPKFLKATCLASLVYGGALIAASYNFFMNSLEKNDGILSFDTNMKISLGFLTMSTLTLIGFSYYARKNVLELGLIKSTTSSHQTKARVVYGNMFNTRGFSEEYVDSTDLTSPSLHMLKIVDTQKQDAATRSKGDYMFMKIKGKNYNFLMDFTSDSAYVNRVELDRFFRSNQQTASSKKIEF